MLCACGKKEATIHLTEIVNGQVTEIHLCDLCSKDHGADFKQFMAPLQAAGMPDLAGMFSKAMGLAPGQDMKCRTCGMTMRDFEKAGRLGCAGCYETFAPYLLPLIKRIHRHDQHQGKTAAGGKQLRPEKNKASAAAKPSKPKTSDLAALRKKLNECIKQEAYEDAARLRDEIQKYEKNGAKKKPTAKRGSE